VAVDEPALVGCCDRRVPIFSEAVYMGRAWFPAEPVGAKDLNVRDVRLSLRAAGCGELIRRVDGERPCPSRSRSEWTAPRPRRMLLSGLPRRRRAAVRIW
jgi:hypothetical protein